VQFVIFAKTRGNNLLQIESHEEENLSDSRSKRKSCSARRSWSDYKEKAAGFRANPAAQFCEFSFA